MVNNWFNISYIYIVCLKLYLYVCKSFYIYFFKYDLKQILIVINMQNLMKKKTKTLLGF